MTVLTSYNANVEDQSAANQLFSFLGVYPGDTKNNYVLADLKNMASEPVSTGIDFAKASNPVLIVPPTGSNQLYHERIAVLVLSSILAACGIYIVIKKKSR